MVGIFKCGVLLPDEGGGIQVPKEAWSPDWQGAGGKAFQQQELTGRSGKVPSFKFCSTASSPGNCQQFTNHQCLSFLTCGMEQE